MALPNVAAESFAALVATGIDPSEAWVQSSLNQKFPDSAPDKWLKGRPNVRQRIRELRQQITAKEVGVAVRQQLLSRSFLIEQLHDLIENAENENAKVRAIELAGREVGLFITPDKSQPLEDDNDLDLTLLSKDEVEVMLKLRKKASRKHADVELVDVPSLPEATAPPDRTM